jgi:hypothetical protein
MAKVELDLRAKIANLQKGLAKTEKQMKGLQTQSNKTSKTMQTNMKQSSDSVNQLTGQLKALLTIGAAVQFTRAMIGVRTEFERFRAVLTNTLGSADAANREFAKIQEFAKSTPFAVKTLTDAFVRLTNQGFKPTLREMTKLGDLAASVGKDFIQLAEAIIDAQVGEFERLKEFGIKARTEGEKITFTFKEQTTTVDKTSKAIREYILTLGDMEGVSGAMAAISETLGGRINNLEDSWDALLDTLGGRSEGIIFNVVEGLGRIADAIEEVLRASDPVRTGVSKGQGILKGLMIGEDGDELDIGRVNQEIDALTRELNALGETVKRLEGDEGAEGFFGRIFGEEEEAERIEGLKTEMKELETIILTLTEAVIKEEVAQGIRAKTIKDVTDEIKDLQKQLQLTAIDDIAERSRLEGEIALRKDLVKTLEAQKTALEKYRKELTKLTQEGTEEAIKLEGWMMDFGNTSETAFDSVIGRLNEFWDNYVKRTDEDVIAQDEKDRLAKLDAEEQKRAAVSLTFDTANNQLDILAQRQEANLQADLARAGNNAKEKERILREFAEKEQRLAIARTIISGAEGIVKVPTAIPYPAAIPFQIALGLQTLAQIGIIRSQKFERGGYDVLKGRRHAQGGVDIGIGEAEEGEGIGVFSRQATRKYGKFLPAFVKAINENEATVTGYGDNAYNIHFDDSRQVGKLEAIRELLAKPEVTYQGKYKIITRNGHVTKVKI